MRLKHIRLSGFKSFVDPTTVSVPADLVAVVGPNGCGKSNVIDAVRWVMGESSAKTLRGDSMADVIFNGSTVRKPVGKAAVELVFDNSEGKAPGAYAKYGEIAVRRELSRDGQSLYFINRTRCRRRDITDIFLGTGLGPRSYSIIEQGMVSRIIEARPEELRVLIEEAAGISKYKERRRETETRMRHTRENLERVEDIRSELETQLRRLKRQSTAAARFKELKQEERALRAQLMSLRWRALDDAVQAQDGELWRCQTQLESKLADQRGAEKEIEILRERLSDATETLNKAQGEFYAVGSEIAGTEQSIQHARETRHQQQQELKRLIEAQSDAQSHLEADRARVEALEQQLEVCRPRLNQVVREFDEAMSALQTAEQAFSHWQSQWDEFGRDSVRPEQEREVQRARLEEHHRQIQLIAARQSRLAASLTEIESSLGEADTDQARRRVAELDARCNTLEHDVQVLDEKIQAQRKRIEQADKLLNGLRHRYQEVSVRSRSLEEIQAAALGANDEQVTYWLTDAGLDHAPRLASQLQVEAGWEEAVDCVLGRRLGAVCVDSLQQLAEATSEFCGSDLFMLERGGSANASQQATAVTLLDKVSCPTVDLAPWLGNIYLAEDLVGAVSRRHRLQPHESVVTPDGVWMGQKWLAVAKGAGAKAGVLVREREIKRLAQEGVRLQTQIKTDAAQLDEHRVHLVTMQDEQTEKRRVLSESTKQRTDEHRQLARLEARVSELQARREQVTGDLADLDQQLEQAEAALGQARERLDVAQRLSEEYQSQHTHLSAERSRLRQAVDEANSAANQAREATHREQFEEKRLRAAFETVRESIARLESQHSSMLQRQRQLQALLDVEERPEATLQEQLQQLLEKQVAAEARLAEARKQVDTLDEAIRARDEQRAEYENTVQEERERVEQVRLTRQELVVRRDTLADQIRETGTKPEVILEQAPPEADEETWQQQLDRVTQRIERIGAVNLVAIEEYEEQSERKAYLDKQHQDLIEALTTLENVIQKIDRETRTRFRETYETLNERFQEFFPQLFGGGNAYLELTGSDLLDTGVGVMARPPGKRNSTIHLLSGGEKALTAVALLFAFFDLNPAPFCMLDEVDAPLDDANVERYCGILKTLSDRTQLIVITHNKITMEAASMLIGVTMGEPGVSRLVSVDVDEAVEMAAQ